MDWQTFLPDKNVAFEATFFCFQNGILKCRKTVFKISFKDLKLY